jgi:hypothetical protein
MSVCVSHSLLSAAGGSPSASSLIDLPSQDISVLACILFASLEMCRPSSAMSVPLQVATIVTRCLPSLSDVSGTDPVAQLAHACVLGLLPTALQSTYPGEV